jgi:hypothetical protein
MDRRHSARVEVQLPVQVWGMDSFGQPFTAAALVTNISTSVDIRMGDERAQFRVVWVGGIGTRKAGEVGVQRITTEAFLPDSVLAYCSQSAAAC